LAHYRYADRLLSLNTGSDTQYYHYDALGSTVNLTNSTGGTEVSYKLDPWGHIRSQSGFSVNRHIFTGQEYDEKTGLIYFGSRYYDPDVARFITQDSYLGEQGTPPSLHRYLYAYSNPTVYVDLMGYFNLSTHIRIAEEAYNDKEDAELQKQSGFSEKKELFIEALAKGAIAPDVVLITAETKSGMPSEELMAVDMMKVDRALNKFNNWFENLSVVQKYQAIKENIVDFAKGKIQKSFPKTYEAGEKGLYWWEDTSVLGPILNKASEYSSSAENVYQSHFGKEAWQHGMAVEGKSAKDIQDALVNNTANLIEVYRNSIAAGKYEEAGFALGIASHYLADTYTPSHTVRENDKITRFQNYKLQSPKLHGDADSPRTDSLVFKNAVDKTKLLIDVANNPLLNNDDLRKHLRENFYAITGKTKAEGTRKEYEIRLK